MPKHRVRPLRSQALGLELDSGYLRELLGDFVSVVLGPTPDRPKLSQHILYEPAAIIRTRR